MGERVINMRAGAVAAILLLVLPLAAKAGPREEVIKAMDQCATIGDNSQRLACFDKLTPQVKAVLAQIVTAQERQPTAEEQKSWFGFDVGNLFGGNPEPMQQATPQQFGADNLPAPPVKNSETPLPGPIDSISATVTDYAFNPLGKFVVFLEGGQVWKETDSDTDRNAFNRSVNRVTISRGFLGSYNMKINNSDKIYKVTRVK